MTQRDKQKFLIKTIDVIKTYFEIDEMEDYRIFFNNGYKTKMGFNDLNQNYVDIFIEYDNLYYSFIDKKYNAKKIVQELCNQQYKETMRRKPTKQVATKCGFSQSEAWWNDYKIFLNDKRFIEQEEPIRDLTAKLEAVTEKLKDLDKKVSNVLNTDHDQLPRYESESKKGINGLITMDLCDENVTDVKKNIFVPFDELITTKERVQEIY